MTSKTLVTLVNGLTSSAYKSGTTTSRVEMALESAYTYCVAKKTTLSVSGSDFTDYVIADDGEAMAVCMLAVAILNEGRRALRAKTDPNFIGLSIKELFTEEMFEMLLAPDESIDFDIFYSSNPVDDWQDTDTDYNVYRG